MNHIREVRKKDIPALLDDESIWRHEFLAVSRHRLYAHYQNPFSDDDVILLLAYTNNELVGYMGAYIDRIILNNSVEKIAWLSTWWVHPKTKGSGIGREILNKMYDVQDGRIGISQFTPSAKRVYDKSGYFNDLKKSVGIKAVLRSHLHILVPIVKPGISWTKPFLKVIDSVLNGLYSIRQHIIASKITNRLSDITLDYIDAPDMEVDQLISKLSGNHISPKNQEYFRWLYSFKWVMDAPLLELTNKSRYEFSMYDRSFSIYLLKISSKSGCIGFVVLQKRHLTMKVLYCYCEQSAYPKIADIIKLHCFKLSVNEVITYDENLLVNFKQSGIFLYIRKKVKHSIISKVFGVSDFSNVKMNYGDGDCSFA